MYFGTDGIRGVANNQITPQLAFECGNALGQNAKKIVIGRDTRQSGDMLVCAFASGVMSAGCNILDMGVVSTPCVAYAVKKCKCNFGVVISASHNPPQFNGIKIFDSEGKKLDESKEAEIEKLFLNTKLVKSCDIGRYKKTGVEKQYKKFLLDSVRSSNILPFKGLKILLDCSNGATGKIAQSVFLTLGGEVFAFNCQKNGKKINVGCGSLNPGFATKKVKELGCDIGFCFDGDGDRIIAVDEKGNIVDGDKILCVLATYFKQQGKLKKDCVVGTSHTNLGAEFYLKTLGIKLLRADIGDRFVNQLMTKTGANLGGEQSGHIIVKDLLSTGDGLLVALLLTKITKNKKLSKLADIKLYPQVNIDVEVKDKMTVLNHEGLWQQIDKYKETFDGRILLRASGTEPKIRIMAEGKDKNRCNFVAQQIKMAVKQI